MSEEVVTVGFVVGLGLTVAGIAMFWLPGAFIVAGLLLCAACAGAALLERRN